MTERGLRRVADWMNGWTTGKLLRSRGFRPGCAADEDGGRGAPGRRCFSKRWVTTRRSSLGDFGHSRLALRREGSDRHRGCYPTDPTGEGCPSFRRNAGRSIPEGGVSFVPGADVSSSPARRVAPVCRRGRKPTSRKAGRTNPPDLRSPSPSAGPWGNALLRRALRRSRTRPRRSPGRASSQLRAKTT